MTKLLSFLTVFLLWSLPVQAGTPTAGDAAPGFSLSPVTGGDAVSLDSLKGKVVLIGMFHICVPCMNQALEFNKVREQVPSEDLVILGINTSGDSKKAVTEYLDGFPRPVQFTYLLDPGQSVHKAYIQRDMPTVLIIDKDGKLKARSPSVGADQLVPYLKKLL